MYVMRNGDPLESIECVSWSPTGATVLRMAYELGSWGLQNNEIARYQERYAIFDPWEITVCYVPIGGEWQLVTEEAVDKAFEEYYANGGD